MTRSKELVSLGPMVPKNDDDGVAGTTMQWTGILESVRRN